MNCDKQIRNFFITAFLSVFVIGSLFAQEQTTRRIGLFVGANEGNPARQGKLGFAQSDAEAVSSIFFELGGTNQKDREREDNILRQPGRASLDRRLDAIKKELADARGKGQRTELIFYYAGHSDRIGINLGSERYNTNDLLGRIQNIEADVRIVILDMCYAGNAARGDGDEDWVPLSFDGCAVLASTEANEESLEMEEIGSTFFTHSLITGLKGAADDNGDANVTLQELYDFVSKEVKIKTEELKIKQTPVFKPKNTGSEETKLTNINLARARFTINSDVTGRIGIWDNSRKILLSDLTKDNQSVMNLAFDFGDYQLRLFRENPSRWIRRGLEERNNNIHLQQKDFPPSVIAALLRRSRGAEAALNFYEPPPGYSSSPDTAASLKPVPIEAALLSAANTISANIPGHARIIIDIPTKHDELSDFIVNELTTNMNKKSFDVVPQNREQLDAINREINRQLSGNVSDESQISLSHNLGADTIITGSIIRNSENSYRLYVNAIDLERGTLYPNSAYSASILNDRQMQRLIGNRSDSTASPQEFYADLGGGYSLLNESGGTYESIKINLAVNKFFTQEIGVGFYGTISVPLKITGTEQGTSVTLYGSEYDTFGLDLLIGPTFMLFKSETFCLPVSVGISYSYLWINQRLQNIEKNKHVIGLGTNISGKYYFYPHIYVYARLQFDFGFYSWGNTGEKELSGSGLLFNFAPGIGVGLKY